MMRVKCMNLAPDCAVSKFDLGILQITRGADDLLRNPCWASDQAAIHLPLSCWCNEMGLEAADDQGLDRMATSVARTRQAL